MKYYIVTLLDKNSSFHLEKMKRTFCKKYKLHNSDLVPMPYIVIDVVNDANIEKLSETVYDTIKSYKKFKSKLSENLYSDVSTKTLSFKVENEGYILKLARKVDWNLKFHGFNTTSDGENWNLFIPIANFNFSNDIMSKKTNSKLQYEFVKIDKVEIWKFQNMKNRVLLKSFELREF